MTMTKRVIFTTIIDAESQFLNTCTKCFCSASIYCYPPVSGILEERILQPTVGDISLSGSKRNETGHGAAGRHRVRRPLTNKTGIQKVRQNMTMKIIKSNKKKQDDGCDDMMNIMLILH